MGKQIIVNVALLPDGTLDVEATDKIYTDLRNKLNASMREDFDTVGVEVIAFLLEHPAQRTIPTAHLVRSIWERRIERGALKGKTTDEKQALYTRLEEVVPEYIKANKDMFHMGRKTGIAIYFVPGDHVVDPKSKEVLVGKDGHPVQAYRHTAEEWTKLTAPKPGKDKGENGAATAESAPESGDTAAAQ